jgi:type VII secretion protein EccE
MSIPSAADLTQRITVRPQQGQPPRRTAPARQAKQRKRSGGGRGRIGLFRPVSIGQVALWELAIVAVAATVYPVRIVSVVVAAVAFVVIVVTSVRWSGLCAYQWVAVLLRFRRRHGVAKGIDPLGIVAPGIRFRRQVDRAGNRAGLAELGDSLAAVVRLTPAANPNPAVLLDVLESAFNATEIRLAGAQLVVWAVPSPPRARYYGDRRDVEPMRVHWLALRYQAAGAPAAAAARGGGDAGAARATATAVMALAGRLAEAGYAGVVLDEPELRQELLVALGSDHPALGGNARVEFAVRETWHDWSIGTLKQTTYQPKLPSAGREVLGRLLPQAAFTCTSYSLRRTARGELRGESRVRVGVHPTVRKPTVKQVAQALGVALLARDGRHAESVVDTLPLAR